MRAPSDIQRGSHPASLHDMRADARGLTAQDRHRPAPGQIVACGHFRENEPCPKLLRLTAKRCVGNARHRGKKHPIGDINVANSQAF